MNCDIYECNTMKINKILSILQDFFVIQRIFFSLNPHIKSTFVVRRIWRIPGIIQWMWVKIWHWWEIHSLWHSEMPVKLTDPASIHPCRSLTGLCRFLHLPMNSSLIELMLELWCSPSTLWCFVAVSAVSLADTHLWNIEDNNHDFSCF